MRTLKEAWDWYRSAKGSCTFLNTLAERWALFPWGEMPPLPNRIDAMDEPRLREMSRSVQTPLDDLAVLVLFSVFEAILRAEVESQIQPEVNGLKHPALKKAGKDLVRSVTEGSFFHGVLEPLKSPELNDLVEHVNQVRRFRNWVAHGRREDTRPEENVDPKTAYSRLQRFLDAVRSLGEEPSE